MSAIKSRGETRAEALRPNAGGSNHGEHDYAGGNVLNSVEESLVCGVEKKGKGSVVYLVDDPLFRSFWEDGKLLFSNAIFMVGN